MHGDIIRAYSAAVGQGDLDMGNGTRVGAFYVTRRAAHQAGNPLRPPDGLSLLVAYRPTAVERNPALCQHAAIEFFALHRLDGITPDFRDAIAAHFFDGLLSLRIDGAPARRQFVEFCLEVVGKGALLAGRKTVGELIGPTRPDDGSGNRPVRDDP